LLLAWLRVFPVWGVLPQIAQILAMGRSWNGGRWGGANSYERRKLASPVEAGKERSQVSRPRGPG
jgi:hypothetical protein